MAPEFQQVITFILELEKLKQVDRKTKPLGASRYENSAEHSWQIALLGLSLLPYAQQQVDPLRVVTMLLLHDVVEIDTGDKFAYDATHDDYENEHAAAKRIFGLLPKDTGQKYLAIWEEFEAAESADAIFAKAVDRLMPVLQNLNNGGQSWKENNVTVSQILTKNAVVAKANPALWDMISAQVVAMGEELGLQT